MKYEVPETWIKTLRGLLETAQSNLDEFTLDGSPEYNKRAVEFLFSPLIGHIKSSEQFTGVLDEEQVHKEIANA